MVLYSLPPAASRHDSVFYIMQRHDRPAQETGYFQLVMKEYGGATKAVEGPDIPVFILPVNEPREIESNFYYQSGMAFDDKVFLFLSPNTPERTHRYIADS
ncbi:DUF2268 domain-containing putative Zn-dependent protease [Bacillus sp. SL00103]